MKKFQRLGLLILIGAFILGFSLINFRVFASEELPTKVSAIYTFWGTSTCPQGWKMLQKGEAGSQVVSNSMPVKALSDTICIDERLNSTFTNGSLESYWSFWVPGSKIPDGPTIQQTYPTMPCVVCERFSSQ